MEHCAIDLGGRKSQICIRAGDGTVLFEGQHDTSSLPHYLRELPHKCRVIVETAAEAFRIADAAMAAGHEVRVVPATLVRTLGVGARRTKTDKRDARALSEVSCRLRKRVADAHFNSGPEPAGTPLRSTSQPHHA